MITFLLDQLVIISNSIRGRICAFILPQGHMQLCGITKKVSFTYLHNFRHDVCILLYDIGIASSTYILV